MNRVTSEQLTWSKLLENYIVVIFIINEINFVENSRNMRYLFQKMTKAENAKVRICFCR